VGQTTDPEGDWTPPSVAVEYARRGVRLKAAITGKIPHTDAGQSPGH